MSIKPTNCLTAALPHVKTSVWLHHPLKRICSICCSLKLLGKARLCAEINMATSQQEGCPEHQYLCFSLLPNKALFQNSPSHKQVVQPVTLHPMGTALISKQFLVCYQQHFVSSRKLKKKIPQLKDFGSVNRVVRAIYSCLLSARSRAPLGLCARERSQQWRRWDWRPRGWCAHPAWHKPCRAPGDAPSRAREGYNQD